MQRAERTVGRETVKQLEGVRAGTKGRGGGGVAVKRRVGVVGPTCLSRLARRHRSACCGQLQAVQN